MSALGWALLEADSESKICMQDARWGYSKDYPYRREGEGHRIEDRKEMNLMQSQQKPFQKGNPTQSYHSPALCCWRNQCHSPGQGIWAISHSIGYKEAAKILTAFFT